MFSFLDSKELLQQKIDTERAKVPPNSLLSSAEDGETEGTGTPRTKTPNVSNISEILNKKLAEKDPVSLYNIDFEYTYYYHNA